MDKLRIIGPTLAVPTGGGAVMTVSLPGADPHLEWSLRYGDPNAVRFHAASVVESFDYLLSNNINMVEAMKRLRTLRAAVRGSAGNAGVPPVSEGVKQ
jgi:predicted HAD superfamily phosphohydrolase